MKKYSNILNESFENIFKNGSAGSQESVFSIDFISKDGKMISDAVNIGRCSESNYSGESTVFYAGEKVKDAIQRLNVTDLEYIIVKNKGYRSWAHQPEITWNKCVVYQNGVDFNL